MSIKLSQQQVLEWRESLVTEAIKQALYRQLEARKAAMFQAYWVGKPPSKSTREAVILAEAMLEDIFTGDADEIIAAVEKEDE